MEVIRTRLGPGGRIVIPAAFREQLHLANGDEVLLTLDEGSTLRLEPVSVAVRRAQVAVRRHVSAEVSLVDELIVARRGEVETE